MWDFLTLVYNGNNGGMAIFICFGILVHAIRVISVHFINRKKPVVQYTCNCEACTHEEEDD